MGITMYSASVPGFLRALEALAHVLRKGEEFARARDYDPALLLQARLAPDMFPLVRQVQIATDLAKNGAARLAGVEPPKFEDDETTFVELFSRIARARDFLGTFEAQPFAGSETREIRFATRRGEMRFNGHDYLFQFVLPNLYFHCAVAYALLREAGVPVGKLDYLGAS